MSSTTAAIRTTTTTTYLEGGNKASTASSSILPSSTSSLDKDNNNCNLCPKSFPSQKLLQQHQHMFHTDKAFICEICAKAFRFRSNLAEHRSVHTALKPYVCKFCGKSSRLKGNLTKHILKHHKKEQNAYIGKDDIIIKKGKKSVKDPAAVDFLEKSMIVLTTSTSENPLSIINPKDEIMDEENDKNRSFLLSLGLDSGSMDLRSNSPEEENSSIGERNSGSINNNNNEGPMECDDAATESSEQIASSGHAKNSTILNNHAAQLVNQVISRTQCTECGKHFRKGSSLQVHMTLNHGFPPPGSSLSSDDQGEKGSDCGAPMIDQTNGNTESTTPPIHQEIREIKNKIDEMRSAQSATRVEQVLSGLDTRVGRLEKQLEMALNSIYTIVQLQTGINSSVTRFKDEISEQLKAIRTILNESAT